WTCWLVYMRCIVFCIPSGASQNSSDSGWEAKVTEFFRQRLMEKDAHTWVPSLNDVPLHYLKPNSLVKFRCLIQDMFDPEFYMGAYDTVDPSTKAKVLRCGKYKDVTECGVDLDSANMVTSERQTFYCVPIPGESPWVKEISSCARVVPSTSYVPSRQKRSYEDDDEDDMDTQPQAQGHAHNGTTGRDGDALVETTISLSHSLTHSLTHTLCKTTLTLSVPYVYADWDSFKLNDTMEVYGILSVSPALSALSDQSDTSSSLILDPAECMETAEELRVHSPPASLVPRLHLIHTQRLAHNNPLLPPAALEDSAACNTLHDTMVSVRAELLAYFTQLLLGDVLAAEYLLLHLISNVYARRDVIPLGKFTLNLSGCPATAGPAYTEQLYCALQQLVPSAYRLSMTLQNMNQLRLVPRKDYVANRLLSGALQLAANTSLYLDETQLEQGQLDPAGVRNITALGNVISWQKVDYDFNYHQMEFPSNINVLIASEGRSLLPSDCHVHLQPQVTPPNMEAYLGSALTAQSSSQLNKFRLYLTMARTLDYSISEEVTKAVEDDFVDMRKDDPQSISADDLHSLLGVARLLCLSLGQSALSTDAWSRAKHIETLRKSRSEPQGCLNGNEP
uniref:Mini-chromosome maintenance complex-binding protein n=1 Tax=Gadus morhua TaxID=8049 RepID=A0A8C5BFV8_GADMO